MGHHTVVTREKYEVYMKSTLKLCPFCDFTNFISHMVHVHVRRHFETAVRYKDFFIVKCSNQCREKAHFHCCFCEKTVINRSQLMTHILSHEPRAEPGVTSDMHIENVMIKDTGVVNWKTFSPDYRDEFRRIYSIRECPECLELFKSYPPGYRGRGKRGELLGFYSEDLCTGFCSQDCFFAAGNEFQ